MEKWQLLNHPKLEHAHTIGCPVKAETGIIKMREQNLRDRNEMPNKTRQVYGNTPS